MRLKICFLSQESPENKKTWSGIAFHLYSRMGKYHDVSWISPWYGASSMHFVLSRILWARDIANRLLKRKFTWHYFLNSYFLGKTIQRQIRNKGFDLIVVGAGESHLIANLHTKLPVIYIADTTFKNMVNYYPWHSNLCKSAIRQGNEIEKNAIEKSFHIIYSSEWAANSAIRDYGADKAKISILHFGANLIRVPPNDIVLTKKPSGKCRMLFIGVHWIRKGGDIAYNTFLELKKSKLDCSLTVIGCDPDIGNDPDLTIIPFLDKNKESDFEELYKIFSSTDLLLIPTRADCTPVVFSEAAAFGIPVITTDTGGVTAVIKEGKNGYCLPLDASHMEYSRVIKELWENKPLYDELVVSSRAEYDARLNWNNWIGHFNGIVSKIKVTHKVSRERIKQA